MSARLCDGCPWHFLPVCLGVTSIFGLLATYFIAKNNCHIEKWLLPYVSYTGTEDPESSVFGLILNTEGFLGILIVVLAWRLVRHVCQERKRKTRLLLLNKLTLITGFLGCVGVIIVANFQVSKKKTPHYIGAALALIVGTVYCIFSSIVTYKIHKTTSGFSSVVCVLRFLVAALMVISIVSMTILYLQRKKLKNSSSYLEKYGASNSSYPGPFRFPNGSCIPILDSVPLEIRYIDLAMSISEWILTVGLLFSLSLYTYEFRYFNHVKIILRQGHTVLTSLHSKSDCISPAIRLQSFSDESDCFAVTCNHGCGKKKTFAEDSVSEINGALMNNNTESRCLHDSSRTDAHFTSQSLPDISMNAC